MFGIQSPSPLILVDFKRWQGGGLVRWDQLARYHRSS